MNDYSNKIVSSWNVLPLGQFWSIYEPAHTVVTWNHSHMLDCFPFGCLGFFFFLFFCSYYNSEVWLKSVGVEHYQLCLRLFSNPVVSMLCFPAYEGESICRINGEPGQGWLSQDTFCYNSQGLELQQSVSPETQCPVKLSLPYWTASAWMRCEASLKLSNFCHLTELPSKVSKAQLFPSAAQFQLKYMRTRYLTIFSSVFLVIKGAVIFQ